MTVPIEMVNIDYQLDSVQNHPGDEPVGVSLRDFSRLC